MNLIMVPSFLIHMIILITSLRNNHKTVIILFIKYFWLLNLSLNAVNGRLGTRLHPILLYNIIIISRFEWVITLISIQVKIEIIFLTEKVEKIAFKN